MFKYCIKRDGSVDPFEKHRIQNAITSAFEHSGEGNREIAAQITKTVLDRLRRDCRNGVPSAEGIQDLVEDTLMTLRFYATAKKYILYRDYRHRVRTK